MSNLSSHVLVLNRGWSPVHVVTVKTALVMLAKGVAKVVDVEDYQTYTWDDWAQIRPEDGDRVLKSVNCEFRVPEVITLTGYDRLPQRKVTFSRRNVYKRDVVCQYCGKQPGTEELTIDHVVPRAQGGVSSWTNCVLACIECNARRADRRPDQCGMRLSRSPVTPKWKPLYANHRVRLVSWSKFISEAYWNIPLQE